jgi:hypothetical protein
MAPKLKIFNIRRCAQPTGYAGSETRDDQEDKQDARGYIETCEDLSGD